MDQQDKQQDSNQEQTFLDPDLAEGQLPSEVKTEGGRTGSVQKKTPPNVWKKGQSGNPAGRTKVSSCFTIAQQHSIAAVRTLVAIMRDDTCKPGERISACREVLRLAGVYEDVKPARRPEAEVGAPSAAQLATEELLKLAKLTGA